MTSILSSKPIIFTTILKTGKRAYQTPNNVTTVRKLNEDSIQLVLGFRNFKRNLAHPHNQL